MGNDAGNNMGNLRADCASGTIDAVVHMGDHAYNMANGNDYHGDAYMQAFQGTWGMGGGGVETGVALARLQDLKKTRRHQRVWGL